MLEETFLSCSGTILDPTHNTHSGIQRNAGLAGLAEKETRSSHRFSPEAITLIEELAWQSPRRSLATLHHHVVTIAGEQGWQPPGYNRVCQMIKSLDQALVIMAHQEFDL